MTKMQTLGILNAIPAGNGAIDWNKTPADVYIRFFRQVNAPFRYRVYDVFQDQFPTAPQECSAYLITGSPSNVYDDQPWIGALSRFVRDCFEARVRLVGFCFGHQMLAHALGGRAELSKMGWGLGRAAIEVQLPTEWQVDSTGRWELYFVHHDQVTALPPGARLLGGNDFCPNAFFAIENRVLGLQGHPEFSTRLMRNILESKEMDISPAHRAAALASLQGRPPDNDRAAQLVTRFLLMP